MCLKYLEDVDVVNKYIDDVKKQITLASSTSMNMKEIGMGVGLDNLGNICYLNAQMQLLHSIKKFVEEV
jgi:ubiquitin C-terminal hydrolase